MSFRATQPRSNKNSQRLLFIVEAVESNVAPIRRPYRREFEGAIAGVCQLARGVGRADLRNVNVLVISLFAHPVKSHLIAVRRERSIALAREAVERRDANFRPGRFASAIDKVPGTKRDARDKNYGSRDGRIIGKPPFLRSCPSRSRGNLGELTFPCDFHLGRYLRR